MRDRRVMAMCLLILAGAAAALVGVLLLLGGDSPSAGRIRRADRTAQAVYQLTVSKDYGFQTFLDQGGAASEEELLAFLNRRGAKLEELAVGPAAGTSFTALTDGNGHRIFARNRDSEHTRVCVIRTPAGPGRHATISTVDLGSLGLEEGEDVSTLPDKTLAVAAPYLPLDGMNDAGLACGLYASGQRVPTDQQSQRPDLTSTTLLRLILDYADSVDQAIELAGSYDLHDCAGTGFHYMVADAKGDSAVLEWVAGDCGSDTHGAARRLRVSRVNANSFQTVTNYVLYEGYYAGGEESQLDGLDRNRYLYAVLSAASGRLADEAAAVALLGEVSGQSWDPERETGHSVVYDLTARTGSWVGNGQFDKAPHTLALAG